MMLMILCPLIFVLINNVLQILNAPFHMCDCVGESLYMQ